MSKYKKYQKYKSLSFPFLDEIPSSWMVVPLYALSDFRQGKLHEPYIDEDGKFICINSRFVSTEGKKFKHCNVNLSPVKKSDILMVMSDLPNGRALAKALFVEGENNYALNQRVCAITPTKVYPRFLYYQLNRNAYFLSFDDGSNQTNLSNYDFKKYPVLLPSTQEQQTIANYLDKATVKIDTLIEKQTKLIELLKEKRQAVISTAVTRGLDSSVPMKDSGVEWLGEIPEHWNESKLKYDSYIKARVGWHGLTSDELFEDSDAYTVTGSDFLGNSVNWTDCRKCTLERYKQDRFIQLKDNDLLVTKDGTIGKIIKVNRLPDIATLNGGIFVIRPLQSKYNTSYYYWLLISTVFTGFVSYYKTGSTISHLYQDTFCQMPYALPSLEEQQVIVDYLDDKTSKIDNLISKSIKGIDLLKEKRTALISAVVTGKIDVRETA